MASFQSSLAVSIFCVLLDYGCLLGLAYIPWSPGVVTRRDEIYTLLFTTVLDVFFISGHINTKAPEGWWYSQEANRVQHFLIICVTGSIFLRLLDFFMNLSKDEQEALIRLIEKGRYEIQRNVIAKIFLAICLAFGFSEAVYYLFVTSDITSAIKMVKDEL
ncbi:hypothetical protein B0I72DRAFT_135627 [Yarrowia lipolytica]|uniref:YALI0B21714p n=2 Tax=Yarrowia lipolytica TaxID=4952 RepID=Q6CDR8_YARLI|nr:YALI0B21714p [Yarrowia lipolytica CLIB122]AOW02043.1 hypothetical protein YALI1_B28374g [Yarrowia lipolytica]KAB8283433.1 hypothetical protein BKA91DRAFT_136715 [Yarrowia lipolytica]KAE8173334.1 hypothetical protein BKA90DRAFT_135918 [Yarrowia lipolytica]KAJ8052810.1 hypothetical protein LXG23DRAFT_52291 [Yarrowia lipolytica]QNP96989.1 Hypothetical protein YALI2_C00642g [Yarrowia lipolytica]|eukprot:XP_501194.2 YALI0B21714p [Yarrowia lipolytica CLIB122]